MTKRKIIALLTAIIMTILLLPIGAFAADPVPNFTIKINGITITKAVVDAATTPIPVQDITTTGVLKSDGITPDNHRYIGYKLSDILKLADNAAIYSNGVTVIPSDVATYGTIDVSKTVIDDANTLIAITRDGLTAKGPFIAPCSDLSAGSYTKNVSSINEILPNFSVKFGDKTITNTDVKKLDVNSYASSTAKITGTFKGYKLSDVLTLAGVDYTNGITVTAPGFTNTYSKDVISNPKTLLAITLNGATTKCPYIAPCDSTVGKDYTNTVATVAATPVPAAPATTATSATTAATAVASTKSGNPKTADASYIAPSIIIFVTSSFMIALIEFKRKKIEE